MSEQNGARQLNEGGTIITETGTEQMTKNNKETGGLVCKDAEMQQVRISIRRQNMTTVTRATTNRRRLKHMKCHEIPNGSLV